MHSGSTASSCAVCEFCPAARHYGALCCEGCRAFFKRKVQSGAEYQCLFGGECRVAYYDRTKYRYCKACRYAKCLQQGMDTNLVNCKELRKKYSQKPMKIKSETALSNSTTHSLMSIQSHSTALFALHVQPADRTLTSSPTITNLQIGNAHAIPVFLQLHNNLRADRDRIFVDTAKAVNWAAFCAFNEQIQRNTDFMRSVLQDKLMPAQPQQSVELTIAYIASTLSDLLQRNVRFVSLLPGYAEVEPLLDQRRLHQRALFLETIFVSFFYEKGEYYVTMGMTGAHFCRYWMDRLINQDLTSAWHITVAQLCEMDLTPTERFLMMAASAFKPVGEPAPPPKLAALHRMYVDALDYSLRARLPNADDIIKKAHAFLGFLDTADGLMQHYVPPEKCKPSHEEAIFCGMMKEDEGIIAPQ